MSEKEIRYVKDRLLYLKYRGINVREIAKGAGVSKNTIYKFLKDEEISESSFWKLRTFVAYKSKSIFMSSEDRKNTNTLTLTEFIRQTK